MPRVSKSAAVQAGRVDDASRDDAKGGAHEMSLAALTTEFAPSGDVAVTGMQRLDMAAGARGVAAQKGDVFAGRGAVVASGSVRTGSSGPAEQRTGRCRA